MSQASTRIAAARPCFPEEDIPGILAEIAEVLRGGRLILGPRVRELEAAWERRTGMSHAIAVSSCSAALEIVMRHVGVAGREVIVPTNTFVATVHAPLNAGARVRFVDIDARDFCLDVDQTIAALGPETAAVIVVHVAGFIPHGFERLRAECRLRGVALIEDCAHAHGSTSDGREAGGLCDAGCFSFYPTKVLTCGVGGLITTSDEKLATLARSLRHHGQGPSIEEIVHDGSDWLMDEVRAVLAVHQTRRLDDFLSRRRAIAAEYDALLASESRVTLPRAAPGTRPAYYKYPVVLAEPIDREAVRQALSERFGIDTGALYWPPTHLMPVFRRRLGTGPGLLTRAEDLLRRQLCLPMHASVAIDDARRVVSALQEVLDSLSRGGG